MVVKIRRPKQNKRNRSCGAECRDTEVHRKNMLDRGYDPKIVDGAIMEIKKRNSQTGVTK
ncbi:hypothetical protein WDV93_23570 [Pantoea ananatis]